MKRVAILGSTGSVGTQTLQVLELLRDTHRVVGLSAGRNVELLIQQVKQFAPSFVSVMREDDAARVREAIADPSVQVTTDPCDVASADSDLVIGALVGGVGLEPVLAAVRRGADVALANKEVLVMAGELVLREARASGAALVPLDSEHVAIHQCLSGQPRSALRRVVLTASGGPFRTASRAEIEAATPTQALAHPNWDMGPKITVDSATLMNKGFEVIEARWLFDLEPAEIDVVVHPESIVHSLVELRDGSWLAQLGVPDMRVPIAYALALPDRIELPDVAPLDLVALGSLHFEAPDSERFPALRLAREALEAGGTAPAVLAGANEVAVRAFLEGDLGFTGIARCAEAVLEQLPVSPAQDLGAILDADCRARELARSWIEAN